mmetsp:Transcript_36075/g.70103  ORF Transcript_36075/g.70103 Transcript_36075/m.70103 type:complete len:261 (-) Transcript_36075:917-1699(-)
MQAEELAENRLKAWVSPVDRLCEGLQGDGFGEGHGHSLDAIRLVEHPRLEEALLLALRAAAQSGREVVCAIALSPGEQLSEPCTVHDRTRTVVVPGALSRRGQVGEGDVSRDGGLVGPREELFRHLLHDDAVVPLRGDAGVRADDGLAEPVRGKEALASTALTAAVRNLVRVPRHQRLNGTAQHDDFGSVLLRLFGVALLHIAQSEVERIGRCDHGHHRVALQLVLEDGGVRVALRTHGEPRGCVAHRCGKGHLQRAQHH